MESGAPEALHQLCHHLNIMGANSYVVYIDKPLESLPILFQDLYSHVKEATNIEDGSLVIFFEIMKYTDIERIYQVKNCTYMLWWLSINNAVQFHSVDINISNPKIIHLFHGVFIKEMIVPHLTKEHTWYYLHDYISPSILSEYGNKDVPKDTMVAHNPMKDYITGKLCITNGIRQLPLIDLERKDFMYTLKKCKVYVDLGAHSGRDRIPREAALLGCIVVTNTLGAANNKDDIAIPDLFKIDSSKELLELLPKLFENYESYYELQKEYRESLLTDMKRFEEQLKLLFIDYFREDAGLLSEIVRGTELYSFFRDKYSLLCQRDSEIQEIVPILYEYATNCATIAEIGSSEKLTSNAFINGLLNSSRVGKKRMICIDMNVNYQMDIFAILLRKSIIEFKYVPVDNLHTILPKVDLLYIDSWHNYGQLKRELEKHAADVLKYIFLYGTGLDGEVSENVRLGNDIAYESQVTGYTIDELQKGVQYAIRDFLEKHPEWKKKEEITYGKGLTILERI
jgi:hypothetical protein